MLSSPLPSAPRSGRASRSCTRTRTSRRCSRPGTARRRALDDANAEIEAGRKEPSSDWKIRYALMLGLERVLSEKPPHLRSGTELRRHQVDALAGMLTELIAAAQRQPEAALEEVEEEYEDEEEYENGENGENGDHAEEELEVAEELPPEKDPGAIRRYRFRHPTASGKTIAAAGFVEAARTIGVLILTHRRLLVTQFNRELTDEGYKDRLTPEITGTGTPAEARPDHDPDLRLVRAAREGAEPRGVPARHLRRGAHRPRREDERCDPQLPRARVHRHDRDRAADREAGLRRLPGVGRRPAARRRRPPRPDRAAPLPPRPARGGDQLGADRRRRLRPGGAGQGARPRRPEPGRREPLPGPLRLDARDRLRRRRRPRVQPRAGVPLRRPEGRGGQRAHAARQARRDPRRLRARRDRRARQRDAPRRGLELAARDRRHAPRADRVEARLPAAHRPDHAPAPAQGGGNRRRLRPEGRDAQRPRGHAALAARLRLLPRRRAGHARAAPPRAAQGAPQALAGAVARPGHARRHRAASP